MRTLLMGVGAVGALLLAGASSNAPAAPRASDADAGTPVVETTAKVDDVPAPPMALLFGIGAVGLFWGRRLAANARRAKEQSKPTD